ncbi:MAG: two pore domain potassium channel family protein [Candidatus Eremiobacteraeota bacterium]|nr:two pore domain potassium channel family protein [Candidatus Eremiobacteraeota bacterium]
MTLFDVFQSVIVPRRVPRGLRMSPWVNRAMWNAWRAYGLRMSDETKREDFLSTYAPFFLVSILMIWVAALIFGYGLMFYGLRVHLEPTPTFGGSLYFAGTTLLTIGYGDIAPRGAPARFLAIFAGATGFATVAIVTSFLFMVFSAFQNREVFVTRLSALAGAPPSGVEILQASAAMHARLGLDELFARGQNWAVTTMETHLAYPILTSFRSNHDYNSWIASLGAVMDAATLLIACVEEADQHQGQARLMYRIGGHLVSDFVSFFGLNREENPGIERDEFERAHLRLTEAGYRTKPADASWEHFSSLRVAYAGPLNALATYWSIPPAQWIGDRSSAKITAHAPRGTS